MASKDTYNNLGVTLAVSPAVLTATNTSAGIDLAGFEGATVVITSGAIAGAGNFTPKLKNPTFFRDPALPMSPRRICLAHFLPPLLRTRLTRSVISALSAMLRTVITLNSGTSIAASAVIIKSHARNKPVA